MFGSHSHPLLGAFPPHRSDVPGDQFDIFSSQDFWGSSSTATLLGIDCRQSQGIDDDLRATHPGCWSGEAIDFESSDVIGTPQQTSRSSVLDPSAKHRPFTHSNTDSDYPSILESSLIVPLSMDLSFGSQNSSGMFLSAAPPESFSSKSYSPAPPPQLRSNSSSLPSMKTDLWEPGSSTFAMPSIADQAVSFMPRVAEDTRSPSLSPLSLAAHHHHTDPIRIPGRGGDITRPSMEVSRLALSLSPPDFTPDTQECSLGLDTLSPDPSYTIPIQRYESIPSSLQAACHPVTSDFASSPVGEDWPTLEALAALMMSSSPPQSFTSASASSRPTSGTLYTRHSNLTPHLGSVCLHEERPCSAVLPGEARTVPKRTGSRGRRVMDEVSDTRKFGCPVCGAGFQRLEHRNRHVLCKHEADKGRPLKCELCSYTSLRQDNLWTHKKTMHNIVKPPSLKGRRGKKSTKDPSVKAQATQV